MLPLVAEQKWSIQYFYDEMKTEMEITDLAFPSAERGIAVGAIYDKASGKESYTAIVTSDGGAHWTRQPIKEYPRSIFFLNDSMGWMVTDKGQWFTEESGRTWKKLCEQIKPNKTLEPATTIGLLLRVWFLDQKHGFGVGLQKTIVETKDGGKTWQPVAAAAEPTGNPAFTAYTHIVFVGGKRGVIVGGSQPPRRDEGVPRLASGVDGSGTGFQTQTAPDADFAGSDHGCRRNLENQHCSSLRHGDQRTLHGARWPFRHGIQRNIPMALRGLPAVWRG